MLPEKLTANTLWIANKENGVSRVTLSEDLRQVKKFKDYNNNSFPLGYDACLSEVDGDVVVTSHHGLWSYDQTRDCLERFTRLENLLDGKVYTYLKADSLKNIWYVADGRLKVLRYDAAEKKYYRVEHETFLRESLIENFEDVYFVIRDRLWSVPKKVSRSLGWIVSHRIVLRLLCKSEKYI